MTVPNIITEKTHVPNRQPVLTFYREVDLACIRTVSLVFYLSGIYFEILFDMGG